MKHPDKIITMTEFVLWIDKLTVKEISKLLSKNNYILRTYPLFVNYAKLLQTPLSLEMFVAVKNEKVLNPPTDVYRETCYNEMRYQLYSKEYEKARKKILFEVEINGFSNNAGETVFEYIGEDIDSTVATKNMTTGEWTLDFEIIEDLVRQIDLTGTENFWNQIFKP